MIRRLCCLGRTVKKGPLPSFSPALSLPPRGWRNDRVTYSWMLYTVTLGRAQLLFGNVYARTKTMASALFIARRRRRPAGDGTAMLLPLLSPPPLPRPAKLWRPFTTGDSPIKEGSHCCLTSIVSQEATQRRHHHLSIPAFM